MESEGTDWQTTLDINLRSALVGTRLAAQTMIGQRTKGTAGSVHPNRCSISLIPCCVSSPEKMGVEVGIHKSGGQSRGGDLVQGWARYIGHMLKAEYNVEFVVQGSFCSWRLQAASFPCPLRQCTQPQR